MSMRLSSIPDIFGLAVLTAAFLIGMNKTLNQGLEAKQVYSTPCAGYMGYPPGKLRVNLFSYIVL